jgi:large subunit ribosomal protein L21
MYAVIEAGGKQYRVELGSEIELDRFEAEPGTSIELGRVLLVADGDSAQIGRPVVDGAHVTADVLRQDRGEKIDVFKYRPKARRRVKKGQRAELTVVRVSDIVLDGRSAAQAAAELSKKDEATRAAAEKEAARKAAADQALAAKLAADAEAAEAAEAVEAAKDAKKAIAKSATTKTSSSAKPSAKTTTAKPTARSAPKTAAAKGTATKSTKSPKSAPKGASRPRKDE